MCFWGRNSSELVSCWQPVWFLGFSETPQNYAVRKERDVLIFISTSQSARASHTVKFELYSTQNDIAPASRATFVNDIRFMVEYSVIVSDVSRTDSSSCHMHSV